jgi:hypothetical protein
MSYHSLEAQAEIPTGEQLEAIADLSMAQQQRILNVVQALNA